MNIEKIIAQAITEDIGEGDHTSLACIPENSMESASLIIKASGIIAGVELAGKIFKKVDPDIKIKTYLEDGAIVKPYDVAFKVIGDARSILKAERLVLNCMQRMSGIATQTNRIVNLLSGLPTKVLDTRKTTPGFREVEKLAVKIGGGINHRMGLYDMIMIKDNHIDFAGGIKQAIEAVNNYKKENSLSLPVEIEARNLRELEEILVVGNVDRIMLDNFSFNHLKRAVHLVDGKYETEASGGINENNARKYAECGVDFISVGALTHQVKSLDMSLKAER